MQNTFAKKGIGESMSMDAEQKWEAQYTPCKVSESDSRDGACWTIVRFDGPDECVIVAQTKWREGQLYRADEAYAKLIAAAPELMEAMKWVLGAIDNWDDVPENVKEAYAHSHKILEKAGAANWSA